MQIDRDIILKAKEKLGDENATIIADELEIEDFDRQNLRCCCPFHQEDHASFIYNPKTFSYHCFAPETMVITRYGVFEIRDIVNKPVEIINGKGEWEKVVFHSYGKQPLLKLTLKRKEKQKVLYATPEHEWIVQRRKGKIQTQNLKHGDRLATGWYKNSFGYNPSVEGLIHGFLFGDGTLNRINKSDGLRCYQFFLWDKKKEAFCKSVFDEMKPAPKSEPNMIGWFTYKTNTDMKSVPELTESDEYLMGFLSGLFVADGNCTDESAIISCADFDALTKIRDIATKVGILSYPICSTTRKPGQNSGCFEWKKDFTIHTLRFARNQIPEGFFVTEEKRFRTKINNTMPAIAYTVEKVETTDRFEDVYCCVTSTHSFVLEDFILTGNCFGSCARNYDILDIFMYKGMTYLQACQKLFELAGIKYSFGEVGVKTKHQYRYPKEVPLGDKSKIYEYFKKRCISQRTLDYADVRQDDEGNIVWNYYDTNDVLTMVKYRPSRIIRKGENKCWCQKDADTSNLLFNMNRINTTAPLLICEGEPDCLSAIESGFTNAVSVPLGSSNYHWIEENWDWLEQFDSIIVCSDNDEAGEKMRKEVVYRLGSWRTKVVEVPQFAETKNGNKVPVNDLNEVLYRLGKEKVLEIILNAKDSPVPGVIDFSDIQDVDIDQIDGIKTGIKTLDRYLMKLFNGTLNIVTGINGCVSADTEFFNGYQWKPISEYCDGERVLQYNLDGTAELVIPEAYHVYPCDHFWEIQSVYGVDQVVSDEHNLVYLTSKGNIAKKSTLELIEQHHSSKNGFQGKFITTFDYSGSGIALTDEEIRLMCAVICDGSMINRKYADTKCRVNIKKERKKERMRKLLNEASIDFVEASYNPKDPTYATFIFVPPIETKSFGKDWYCCTKHQLQVIADEILFWDGCCSKGRKKFSTTDKETADFVQFVFSATGHRSRISENNRIGQQRDKYIRKSTEYCVSYTDQIHPTIFNCKNRIEIPKVPSVDGKKYCFTVNSGMLVLRHNGVINITGNSGKSSFINNIICQSLEEEKNVFLFSGELPNFQTKNWLNSVFAGQRHLEERHYDDSVYYKVRPDAKKQIEDYYRGRLYVYEDGRSNAMSDLMKTIEDSVRKYGTKLIILDNLTAINLECSDDNKYSKQSELIMQLIAFAVKFNVVVVLVVHPHKIDTMRRLNKMDVQGISAIIDLAHRIISLYRVQEKDHQGEPKLNGKGWRVKPIKEDVLIDILKDRMLGYEGRSVGVFYDQPSRRFFTNETDLDRQYSWDKTKHVGGLPFPPKQLIDEEDEVFGNVDEQDRG